MITVLEAVCLFLVALVKPHSMYAPPPSPEACLVTVGECSIRRTFSLNPAHAILIYANLPTVFRGGHIDSPSAPIS